VDATPDIAEGDIGRTLVGKVLSPAGSTGKVEIIIRGGPVDPQMPPISLVRVEQGYRLRYGRSQLAR
jgi:hypothetical protein